MLNVDIHVHVGCYLIPIPCTYSYTLCTHALCTWSVGMFFFSIFSEHAHILATMLTNSYSKLCVDILSVACGWWIKYTLNVLDVSDVIMDVVDLYVNHVKF